MNGASELDGASSKDNVEGTANNFFILKVFKFYKPCNDVIRIVYLLITEKGVPDFWLNAMKRNELLSDEARKLNIFCFKGIIVYYFFWV